VLYFVDFIFFIVNIIVLQSLSKTLSIGTSHYPVLPTTKRIVDINGSSWESNDWLADVLP